MFRRNQARTTRDFLFKVYHMFVALRQELQKLLPIKFLLVKLVLVAGLVRIYGLLRSRNYKNPT